MVFPTREIKDKNAEKFNILKIANKHDMGCYVRVSEREGCHLSQVLTDGKIQKWSGGGLPRVCHEHVTECTCGLELQMGEHRTRKVDRRSLYLLK